MRRTRRSEVYEGVRNPVTQDEHGNWHVPAPPGAHAADPLDFRWIRGELDHVKRIVVCVAVVAVGLLLTTIGVALYTIATASLNRGC